MLVLLPSCKNLETKPIATEVNTVHLKSYVELPSELTTKEVIPEVPDTLDEDSASKLIADLIRVASDLNTKIEKIFNLQGEIIDKQEGL